MRWTEDITRMTHQEMEESKERGRLLTARHLAEDPAALARMEQHPDYGVEFCRNRWPEAYKTMRTSEGHEFTQEYPC